MEAWADLHNRILSYHPTADLSLLNRLHHFFSHLSRQEAEPFAAFPLDPLAIAHTLTELRLDTASVVAGMLVGPVHIGLVDLAEVRREFGEEVAFILEHVARISLLSSRPGVELQAEEFRKMVLAMAKEIRVILVRLAVCLEQLRSVAPLHPEQAPPGLATVVLEIYAPIAHRLGIHWLKSTLEDLAFRLLQPDAYAELHRQLQEYRRGGEDTVQKVVTILKKKLRKYGVNGEVYGREKHLYSIWNKLKLKQTSVSDLYDLVGYRIIVRKKAECYRVLGIIHNEFKPVPGRFKDYIALPKINGYQSLHTVVFGPFDNRIEIQIRTEKMHHVADSGVAAHWRYKAGGIAARGDVANAAYDSLRRMLEEHKNRDEDKQFLENVKLDLFPDEIYVFTPAGKIITLPRGATPVDFAYAVHSQVGDACQGCKVNGRMVPVRNPLFTGDTVEIITGKNRHPNPSWLQFVVSSKAKYWISRWVKTQQREQTIALGREALERELRKAGQGVALNEKGLQRAALSLNLPSQEEVLYRIGSSFLSPVQVAHRMFPELIAKPIKEAEREAAKGRSASGETERKGGAQAGINLAGLMPDMMVSAARCCGPVPGDQIVGIVTTGKGISIHAATCPNLASLNDQPDRWLDNMVWPADVGRLYPTRLRAMVRDEKGSVAQISQAVSDVKAGLLEVQIRDRHREPCFLVMEVEVSGKEQLEVLMQRLRSIPTVLGVERMRG